MLGRSPSARSRTVRNILSTSCLDSAIAAPSRLSAGDAAAFDPAQLHAQGGEHLPDMIVQLTGEIPPLFFLRRDQPLGELPHLTLRLFRDRPLLIGSPLGHAQSEDDRQRDDQAQEHRLPEQTPQVIPECGMAARDLFPLFRQIRIVQLLNLLGDGERGVTPRDDLGTQKAGAPKDLLGDRPIEQRVECLPVVLELQL